jgi:hypothetical protein
MSALRVYDSDITEEMRALARDLAREYRGNWESMIAVKQLFTNNDELPDNKLARSILNMSLSDTTQGKHWSLIREFLDLPDQDNVVPMVRRRREPKPEPTYERKWSVDLRARVTKRYARADVKQAVCHIVNHESVFTRWSWPHRFYNNHRIIPRMGDVMEPQLMGKWMCGGSFPRDKIVISDEPDRRICAKCIEMEAQQ